MHLPSDRYRPGNVSTNVLKRLACGHRLHPAAGQVSTDEAIMSVQITGQPSVLYYAGEMFQRAGLRMGQESAGIAGILGAFKLLMTGAHPTHFDSLC